MNPQAPLGGSLTSGGIWVPGPGVKSDRSVTGVPPQPRQNSSRILSGGYSSENRFKDLSSYINAVKTVPWVWACVSVIAYNFANNEYQYLDSDGSEIDDAYDPFLRLWERPNKRQSGFHFRELMAHYLMLAGEAFISLEDWDANDQPNEMYLPNPARMRVHQNRQTGEIDQYWYDAGGTGASAIGLVPYEPFEIIHVKFANPLDELRGLGAVEAMESTLNIVAEMTGTELSYWKSGGRITGVLETEEQVDDLTFEKLVNRWREFTSGSRERSRFKTAILEQGLHYQPIAEGMRGLDMTKLEHAKREEVLANFGVPQQKIAIFNADSGYKSDDADRFFYGETMEPIFTRVEDGLAPLVDIFNPDNVFRFARRNYEDDSVKLANAKTMQSLGFTFGELAEYLGLDPPDDIRKDMIFPVPGVTGLTLDQLEQMSKDPVEHPATPPPPPPKPTVVQAPPGQVPLRGVTAQATGNENGTSRRVDVNGHLPNTPESVAKYLSEEEVKALAEHYEDQLEVTRAVRRAHRRPTSAKGILRLRYSTKAGRSMGAPKPRRASASVALGAAELVKRATASIRARLTPKHKPKIKQAFTAQRQALTPVLKQAAEAFKKLEDAEQRQAWLRERWPSQPLAEAISALHQEAANDGWKVGKRSLGFSGKGSIAWETKAEGGFVSPVLASRYDRLPGRRITGVDNTTISAVEQMVSEGLRRNYSPLQIANGNADEDYDGVASIFDDEYRAEEIARTESMFAANWGATTGYLDSGVQQVEAMDGRDDPECAERDGQIFDLDPDTGRAVDDNGDPVEDHPNGTLAWAPVVTSDLVETGALDDGSEGELQTTWERKGDVAGHEFHGNQHTGGLGGGGGTAVATRPQAGSHADIGKNDVTDEQHLNHHRLSTLSQLTQHLKVEHGLSQEDVTQQALYNGLVSFHDADHGRMPLRFSLGQRVAPEAAGKDGPLAEAKGDVEGHEFHGNQHTGGLGGGGHEPVVAYRVSDQAREAAARAIAALPPDIRAHAEQVRGVLGQAMKAGIDTEHAYDSDPVQPGHWDPEREQLHERIVQQILDEAKDVPNGRQAIIMGGLGGSGKTSLLMAGAEGTRHEGNLINTAEGKQVTAAELLGVRAEAGGSREVGAQVTSHLNINADDIKERLINAGAAPKVAGLSPMETSPLLHEESSYISRQVAERAAAQGKNLIFDVTLGSASSGAEKIGFLHDHGYKVNLAYVSTTVEHSISSATARYERGVRDYQQGHGTGGRFVPPEIMANAADETGKYRSKNEAAFHDLIASKDSRLRPDRYVKVDNEGFKRELVMRGGRRR